MVLISSINKPGLSLFCCLLTFTETFIHSVNKYDLTIGLFLFGNMPSRLGGEPVPLKFESSEWKQGSLKKRGFLLFFIPGKFLS